MSNFWLAIIAIVVVATVYELYPPAGLALAAIAIVTMFLAFKG